MAAVVLVHTNHAHVSLYVLYEQQEYHPLPNCHRQWKRDQDDAIAVMEAFVCNNKKELKMRIYIYIYIKRRTTIEQ